MVAASALGLKEMLPPYLDKNLTMDELKTGVSFASAGSGLDNATCLIAVGISVDPCRFCGRNLLKLQLSWMICICVQAAMTVEQQLQLFMEYKTKVGSIPGRSLYLICWGSNDVVQHFTFNDGLSDPDYADLMTQRASNFIQVPS